MTQLPNAYNVGEVQYTHAGFQVCKIVGKFSRPMEPVGKIHEAPEAALKALDKLGVGYAVFRMMRGKDGYEPRELIRETDLPILIVNYVGPPRNK